jgi:hypothetical protein
MYLFHDDMVWSTCPTTTGVARCLQSAHCPSCVTRCMHATWQILPFHPSRSMIDRLIPGRLPVYCWWSLLSSDMPKHRSICLEYLMQYMHVSCLGFFWIRWHTGVSSFLIAATMWICDRHACARHTGELAASNEMCYSCLCVRVSGRHGRGRRSHACLRPPLATTPTPCHLLSSLTACMVELLRTSIQHSHDSEYLLHRN